MIRALALFLIAVFSCARAFCETSVAMAQFGVGSQVAPANLLDNFDDGVNPNFWGGNYSVFDDATSSTVYHYDASFPFAGAKSLAIKFDLPKPNDYGGVVVALSKTGSEDLRIYKFLEFYVRGDADNLSMKIELHNSSKDFNHNSASVYIKDYLGGGVTTVWQKVQIPLIDFSNLDSFSNVTTLIYTFENNYNRNNSFLNSGTLYYDDIEFIP